ncbi:MAG: hypothetical protein P9L90_05020 [Candidatus Aadella gelida]|nr:hypothetical protein [Candidatus Aadella gelida]
MKIATPQEINNFLHVFKFYADCPGCFHLVDRKDLKNIATTGLTFAQAREVILQLTYIDYIKGPVVDMFYKDYNVWEFGQELEDIGIYIKLSDNFDHKMAKCISFHIAKHSMTYPYNKKRGK